MNEISDIYKKFAPDVYRYSLYKLGRKEAAEDALAETFAALMKQDISQINNIKAWLIATARNICFKHMNVRGNHANWEEYSGTVAEQDQNPEEVAIDELTIKVIEEALKLIDPETAEVILMRVWQELQFGQIAQIVGQKESAVKLRFYRGIEKLKAVVNQKRDLKPLSAGAVIFLLPKAAEAHWGDISTVSLRSVARELNIKEPKIMNSETQITTAKIAKPFTAAKGLIAAISVGILALAIFSAIRILQYAGNPYISSPVSQPTQSTSNPVSQPTVATIFKPVIANNGNLYLVENTPALTRIQTNGSVVEIKNSDDYSKTIYTTASNYRGAPSGNPFPGEMYIYDQKTNTSTLIGAKVPNAEALNDESNSGGATSYWYRAGFYLQGFSNLNRYAIYVQNRALKAVDLSSGNLLTVKAYSEPGRFSVSWYEVEGLLVVMEDFSISGDFLQEKVLSYNGTNFTEETFNPNRLTATYGGIDGSNFDIVDYLNGKLVRYRRTGMNNVTEVYTMARTGHEILKVESAANIASRTRIVRDKYIISYFNGDLKIYVLDGNEQLSVLTGTNINLGTKSLFDVDYDPERNVLAFKYQPEGDNTNMILAVAELNSGKVTRIHQQGNYGFIESKLHNGKVLFSYKTDNQNPNSIHKIYDISTGRVSAELR